MKKLNQLEKKDKNDKKNDNKQNSVTGNSINNYMNEFNEQKNDISESRDKSQIDDDVKLIRDEILNEDNNKNNEKIIIMKIKLKK